LDIWSIGCILAELIQKKPRDAILKGNGTLQQLQFIFELFGYPEDESDIKGSANALKYVKNHFGKIKSKDLKNDKRFVNASEDCIYLIYF
jgi:hypothetical protein